MLRIDLKSLIAGLVVLQMLHCGGSTETGKTGRTGSGGSAGSGGSGGAGAAGRSGGSSGGTGGSAGSGGSSGRGGGSAGSYGADGTGGSSGTDGTGGTASYGACSMTSECMVRPRDCCGSCGAATRTNAIAINRGNADSYTLAVCENSGCPECYMPQDPTLLGRCEGGACKVVDLRAQPLTACTSNADCRVRTTSCCECGGNVTLEALIAIRRDAEAEYQRLACDLSVDCDACLPPYPSGAVASCQEGRCTVSGASGTTPQAQ